MGRKKGGKNRPKPAADVTPVHVPDEHPVDEGDLGEPHHAERLSKIEEIAQQNRDDRDDEQDEVMVADEENNEIRAATEKEKAELKGIDEESTGGEEPVIETKGEPEGGEDKGEEPVKRKFTIDGKEQELTDDEITAIVQKSGAVDSRLKEATELLRDAKQTTSPTPPPEAQPPDSSSSESDAGGDREAVVKELTDAFVYGNEEQVAKAIGKLLGEGRASADVSTQIQAMTPEQVQGYVVETIAFNEGKRLLDLPPDKGGYSDLWSDPTLQAEFKRRENELRDANDPRSYVELYNEIGNDIRKWRDDLIKQHTPKTGLENRTEAKRQTGVVRGAGSTKTPPTESKSLSDQEKHEETLKQAATARGQ